MKASLLFILLSLFLTSPAAFAAGQNSSSLYKKNSAAREFVLSSTYGVLAGTLIGAATLVFEDEPGDNLNHVARGASWGLYAGLLLGAYVAYWVPRDIKNRNSRPAKPRARLRPIDNNDYTPAPDPDNYYQEPYDDNRGDDEDEYYRHDSENYYDETRTQLKLIPMISERGIDGMGAVLEFQL